MEQATRPLVEEGATELATKIESLEAAAAEERYKLRALAKIQLSGRNNLGEYATRVIQSIPENARDIMINSQAGMRVKGYIDTFLAWQKRLTADADARLELGE